MAKKGKARKPYKFKQEKLDSESANTLIPQAKGNIPKLAVLLGLLSPQYYEIYCNCDGKRNIADVAEVMDIEIGTMRMHMDLLLKNGLINIEL